MPEREEGSGVAHQETAAEQLERYKTMPSFARDFRNKALDQQTEVYQEFGIKHAVHRKMFEFLCVVIQDALVRTGRSFTTYKYYADAVLKWASNPNNLRSMPGFPRSEDTLKTNFEPLLELLVEKGVLIVGQDPQAGDERRTISFAFENSIKSNAEAQEHEKIAALLEGEYAKIKAGAMLPLPSRRQIEKVLEHEISGKIRIQALAPQKYTKRDLASLNAAQTDFFEIDFGNQYLALVPPRFLQDLREIGASRLVGMMQDIALVRRLDAVLAGTIGGEKPPTVTALFSEKNGRLPAFEKHLAPWLVVIKKILDEVRENEGATPVGRAKFYPVFLLYNWLIQEQREEQRSAVEMRVFEVLYAHLVAQKRAVTADEMRYLDAAQAYINEHSIEEFDGLFERFVQGWSLQSNPGKPETIIQIKGSPLGTVYIQSKNGFEIFAAWPVREERKIGDMVESVWVRPLVEMRVSSDISQSMNSDEGFETRFARALHDAFGQESGFQLFFSLLALFTKSPAALTSLAGRSGIAAGRFLMQGGDGKLQMRPVSALCGWNRQRILEEVERRTPFMRKLIAAIKGLFGGGGKKEAQSGQSKKKVSSSHGNEGRGQAAEQHKPVKDAGTQKKAAKGGEGTEGPDATAKAKAAQKAVPKNLKLVSSEELFNLFSKGKSKAQHLAIWNRQLGQAADENKRIVDEIVAEKLGPIKRKLKGGEKTVEIGLHAYYILNSPRLDGLQNKESLFAYVGLAMLEALEEFRKANRLNFTYLAKK